MGKLTKVHFIEGSIWISLVGFLFLFSYEFDKDIEIYKFGAAGWPRAILAMLSLVIIGNFFHQMRHGSAIQTGRVGISEDEMVSADKSIGSIINVSLFLLAPLIYAWSLKSIGFYSATPFFIASVIFLLGERKMTTILSITAFTYTLLISLFLLLLNAPLPQGTLSPFYDFSAFMLRISYQLQNLF